MSLLEDAVERVGDRWTLLTVAALLPQPLRFNDLMQELSGVAPNILSHRLKRLEAQGIVVARPYSRRPPRFLYELTAPGRELAGALRLLAQWAAGGSEVESPNRHATCGTPMEARWYCPTCERAVEEGEIPDLHFV